MTALKLAAVIVFLVLAYQNHILRQNVAEWQLFYTACQIERLGDEWEPERELPPSWQPEAEDMAHGA